ncbi:thiamine phosphate synthase [Muribaculaceae bacterium Isolate-105 (HZI)]|uniref:thiamine phosphate synthase n=2 Tax=Paramuribaculum intestinale TaxID=2094151 RepID=UPI000F4859E4|nr:thiamine phosphate synthase [Paramuribaculum intestinale]ROT13363.1 thiamine phosphate synthase [Muribaculaceae bacterium Isolate-105 (HZI)]
MTDMMRIAVTGTDPRHDEGEWIATILREGWDAVHLRHPAASLSEMRRLIESVPQQFHSRLRLHGHFELTNEFNVGGLHLNRRCPAPPANYRGGLSRSCHTIEEIATADSHLEYVTLSPVFDSISKPGYTAAFSDYELESIETFSSPIVIALGGVTPERIDFIRRSGFGGYAVLGYLWAASGQQDLEHRLRQFV